MPLIRKLKSDQLPGKGFTLKTKPLGAAPHLEFPNEKIILYWEFNQIIILPLRIVATLSSLYLLLFIIHGFYNSLCSQIFQGSCYLFFHFRNVAQIRLLVLHLLTSGSYFWINCLPHSHPFSSGFAFYRASSVFLFLFFKMTGTLIIRRYFVNNVSCKCLCSCWYQALVFMY